MCHSHWSKKYKLRSSVQGTCRVSTSRRGSTQSLVVVGLTVGKIWNIDVNCVRDTGARNIGQGHRVKVPAESGDSTLRSTKQGLVVVDLIVEEILNVQAKCVNVTEAQNIGQGHLVKVSAGSVHVRKTLYNGKADA